MAGADTKLTRRAGDEVVVPTLAVLAIVVGEEAVRAVLRVRQLGPPGIVIADRRRSGYRSRVVCPPHPRDEEVVGRVTEVEPRLPTTRVDRLGLGAVAEDVCGVHRLEDLPPGDSAVSRTPGAVAEDTCVQRVGRVRVELQLRDAT